jgi:TetR/AcrR family transcriptional repressor of bet genes
MEPLRRKCADRGDRSRRSASAATLDVTMSEIAGRAGVSSALAHHYFGAKDDLLARDDAARCLSDLRIDTSSARGFDRQPTARAPACRPIIAVNFSAEAVPAGDVIAAWLAFYVEAQRSPALRRLLRDLRAHRLQSNLTQRPGPAPATPCAPTRPMSPKAISGADRRALHPPGAAGRARPMPASAVALVEDYVEHASSRHGGQRMNTRQPNILIVMVDQLAGTLSSPTGRPTSCTRRTSRRSPRARRASRNNYTASPLCAPGRAAFMSGQLPSRTRRLRQRRRVSPRRHPDLCASPAGVPATTPCLSGKMHFVGPDQMHGFEEQADDRRLPGRFRLDAGLPQAGRAHRLVVPQSRLGDRRGHGGDHQPAGV